MKVSVIMPLYNAERYVEESLRSVLNQTLSDFELICINDGSTDETLNILQAFQKKEERLKILENKGRQGAAYSRNRGLEAAEGTYISFLDGDDIYEEEMLEKSYHAIVESDSDIVMFEYMHVPSEDIYQKKIIEHGTVYKEKYCQHPFRVQDGLPCEFLNWAISPCNKLYKKEFIVSEHLEFQSLPCANDVYFGCMALMLAQKIIVLDDKRVMVYARDHFEPSRISFNRDPMNTYKAMEKLQQELIRRGKFEQLYQHFYCALLYMLKFGLELTKDNIMLKKFYHYLQTEGIHKICSVRGEFYERADNFIKAKLAQYETLDLETYWYKEMLILDVFLEENAQKVVELFHDFYCKNKRVGIWGAGRNGRILLDFCNKHQLKIDTVIDADLKKTGGNIAGYLIQSPDYVCNELQVIVVSGLRIAESVKSFLNNKHIDIQIIDINEYLGIV